MNNLEKNTLYITWELDKSKTALATLYVLKYKEFSLS